MPKKVIPQSNPPKKTKRKPKAPVSSGTSVYLRIRKIIESARGRVAHAVNSEMVQARHHSQLKGVYQGALTSP